MKRFWLVYSVFLIGLLFVPVLILLFAVTPADLAQALASGQNRRAFFTTLTSGVIALAVIVILGTPLSAYLARLAPVRIKRLAGGLLAVPLLMPPLVIGLVLAFVLGPSTWIGSQLGAENTFQGLVIAQIFEALPYYVIAAWGYLAAIPARIEEDLYVLGKKPWETFWYAVWPESRPGLAVAGAMAWARIVGAFGAPIVVAYHPSALPVAIWIRLEEYGLPQALALAFWMIVISLPLPLWLNRGGYEKRYVAGPH